MNYNELKELCDNWVKENPEAGWAISPDGGLAKINEDGLYTSHIGLGHFHNACVESNELCLAFKDGYMVWLSANGGIIFDWEPNNPLFK